jgi:hypothetical protein
MGTLETERVERDPHPTGIIRSVEHIMEPISDGSLDIHTAEIESVGKPVRVVMKQAVRAIDVGQPEKPACGDFAGVFSETYAENGVPMLTATTMITRDFLSLGRDDSDFWQATVQHPEVRNFAARMGIPLSPDSLPDVWTASYLRSISKQYHNHLGRLRGVTNDPYIELIRLANHPHLEHYRHTLTDFDHDEPLPGPLYAGLDFPRQLGTVDFTVFDPIDRILAYATAKTGLRPTYGLCGDIQTVTLYIQLNNEVYDRTHPTLPTPSNDVLIHFRSNADQVSRSRFRSNLPWRLTAQNNNFLAEKQFDASTFRPESANYHIKPMVYWMSGAGTIRRYDEMYKHTPMGNSLYSLSIEPVTRPSQVQVETVTDGMLLRPNILYRMDNLSEEPRMVIQTMMDAISTENAVAYAHLLQSLRSEKNIGWIPRRPHILDHIAGMTKQEYTLFLKIRNDLGLQRADDATFTGLYA